jgi:hypothetical protein
MMTCNLSELQHFADLRGLDMDVARAFAAMSPVPESPVVFHAERGDVARSRVLDAVESLCDEYPDGFTRPDLESATGLSDSQTSDWLRRLTRDGVLDCYAAHHNAMRVYKLGKLGT